MRSDQRYNHHLITRFISIATFMVSENTGHEDLGSTWPNLVFCKTVQDFAFHIYTIIYNLQSDFHSENRNCMYEPLFSLLEWMCKERIIW